MIEQFAPDQLPAPVAAPVVDIVVPVYNEEADLARSVRRLDADLAASFPYPYRITIADNASTDATWAIAEGLAAASDAVRAVHRGEAVIDPQATPAVLGALVAAPATPAAPAASGPDDGLTAGLTPREVEVLTLIGRGRTNAEIGAELYIAETTVKTHVGNLLMKLAARDRVALVVLAHAAGLVG